MKEIHQRLLDLAQTQDLGKLTYREIGSLLGGEHPYQVQYNIGQLLKAGKLLRNKRTGSIYLAKFSLGNDKLVSIPILGSVSCGIAVEIANNEFRGFISVSPSLINARSPEKLFALRATGDSMDAASINGTAAVNDGDYVIVRQSDWGEAKDGDYVISLIGDCANLKRIILDRPNSRIILRSESHADYPPIIIADEDIDYYKILGIATGVVKAIPSVAGDS